MRNFIIHKGTHIKDRDTTSKIMRRLFIALLPIIIFGFYKNGYIPYVKGYLTIYGMFLPLIIILVSTITSLITEGLFIRFIQQKKDINFKETFFHSYALFPGLFLGLIIPLYTPISVVILGSIIATIIGKMLYGGFGHNIFNPALIGCLFITFAYGSLITASGGYPNAYELDTIGGATPLANLTSINYLGTYQEIVAKFGTLGDFFIGNIPGTIGEVSSLLCLLGFVYLAITKVIKWKISIIYILTVFIMTLSIGLNNNMGIWFGLMQILSGGLMFGAVFMATDPVTSPSTNFGQILYGMALGLLTVIFRFLTPYPEGVLTSILTMNLLVIIFDKIGISVNFNKKSLLIPLVIMFILIISITMYITNQISKEKTVDNNFQIIEINKKNNILEYTVTQKGFSSLIKAKVIIQNKEFKSIEILNHQESYYERLEEEGYINKLNQSKDLEQVDTVSGATVTSKAIKTLIQNVLKDVN